MLDYDDLLLYWFHMMSDDALAARVGALFDHVLVDEYQDTNTLQAEILRRLKPDGRGVTVVGDDAQAIYSFRAACVDNILAFPRLYDPPAAVVTLEQNYRSTEPILDAANAVIALATERYEKQLFSLRRGGERPQLATVADELAQVDFVVRRILERREAGVPLRQQAVLFRAAHHSDALEVELGRRNIPFVKFGGLRFLEAAHVKDALACLRWAENPRDTLAAFRVAQLLPGMGPRIADRLVRHVGEVGAAGLALPAALAAFGPPAAAAEDWPAFAALFALLCGAAPAAATPWTAQMGLVRRWYQPHLERIYDDARVRLGDLEQLEQLAAAAPSRERFLSDLTLDPPQATGAEAGVAAPRRGLPDPVDDPLRQGAGVGQRLHPQRRRRIDAVGPGHRASGADRGGAPPALRRDDAREERRWRWFTRCASSCGSRAASAIATSTRRARASSPTRSSIASTASRSRATRPTSPPRRARAAAHRRRGAAARGLVVGRLASSGPVRIRSTAKTPGRRDGSESGPFDSPDLMVRTSAFSASWRFQSVRPSSPPAHARAPQRHERRDRRRDRERQHRPAAGGGRARGVPGDPFEQRQQRRRRRSPR